MRIKFTKMSIIIDKTLILNKIMDHLNFKKKADFAKFLGIAPTTLSSWYSRNTFDKELIYSKCEFLNPSWLLTGEGPMLKEETKNPNNMLTTNLERPTGYYYPDVSASAGLNMRLENTELQKIPVSIPGWGTDMVFINVYGDSMYPKYNSGEIIAIKEIDFEFINYGFPYVVVFKNGDVYIKYIKKGKEKNHILLVSENKFYDPKEFHLDLIRSVYSIKGVIKKELM